MTCCSVIKGVRAILRGTAVACILTVLLPAVSCAAPGAVPPGVSGANQYTETLPGPGGNESTAVISGAKQPTDKKSTRAPAQALGAEQAATLESLGPEGRAAARLAADGVPARSGGKNKGQGSGHPSGGGKGGGGKGTTTTAVEAGDGSGAVNQVLGQVVGSSDSGGGMGLLLPLLIAMSVVAAAGYAVGRRRGAGRNRSA
jgi:hypothetical protein